MTNGHHCLSRSGLLRPLGSIAQTTSFVRSLDFGTKLPNEGVEALVWFPHELFTRARLHDRSLSVDDEGVTGCSALLNASSRKGGVGEFDPGVNIASVVVAGDKTRSSVNELTETSSINREAQVVIVVDHNLVDPINAQGTLDDHGFKIAEPSQILVPRGYFGEFEVAMTEVILKILQFGDEGVVPIFEMMSPFEEGSTGFGVLTHGDDHGFKSFNVLQDQRDHLGDEVARRGPAHLNLRTGELEVDPFLTHAHVNGDRIEEVRFGRILAGPLGSFQPASLA